MQLFIITIILAFLILIYLYYNGTIIESIDNNNSLVPNFACDAAAKAAVVQTGDHAGTLKNTKVYSTLEMLDKCRYTITGGSSSSSSSGSINPYAEYKPYMTDLLFKNTGWMDDKGIGCDYYSNVVCNDRRDSTGLNELNGLCDLSINAPNISLWTRSSPSNKFKTPWSDNGGTIIELSKENSSGDIITNWGYTQNKISDMFGKIPADVSNITWKYHGSIWQQPHQLWQYSTDISSVICNTHIPTWQPDSNDANAIDAITDTSMVVWHTGTGTGTEDNSEKFIFCRNGAPNFNDPYNIATQHFTEYADGTVYNYTSNNNIGTSIGTFRMKYYNKTNAVAVADAAADAAGDTLDTPAAHFYNCPGCGGVDGCRSMIYA